MNSLRILRARPLFVVILLVFALSVTTMISAANGASDLQTDGDEVQETYFIYLPAISNQSSIATSSATLAQPPAVQQLGGLAGVLVAGLAMGIALLFWREPEPERDEENTEE